MKQLSLLLPALYLFSASALLADYAPPPGGWAFQFEGDSSFSAAPWDHANNSDVWDGTAPGGGGSPGGAGSFTSGGSTFFRLEDVGNPGGADPNNRKVTFHNSSVFSADPMGTGLTIHIKLRLASAADAPLDGSYPLGPQGTVIEPNGYGQFGVAAATGSIGFALGRSGIDASANNLASSGLTMNSRQSTFPSNDVGTNGGGIKNVLAIAGLENAEFQEFWISIDSDFSGGGTHRVDVFQNGSGTPSTFHTTSGDWTGIPFGNNGSIYMGSPSTAADGAFDIDYFRVQQGAFAPVVIPEPSTIGLFLMGMLALAGARRRW